MSGFAKFLATAHGHEVLLEVPQEVADEVANLAEPWVRVRPAEPGQRRLDTVSVALGDDPEVGQGLTPWQTQLEGEPARRLLLDHAERRIVVVEPDARWWAFQCLRAVRNLLRWSFLSRGEPCLHGGLVEVGGAGIAIVGGKRAGKTSTVIALLGLGAHFIANDDAGLMRDGEQWAGVGWPRSINVRSDAHAALAASPGLAALARLPDISTHPSARSGASHGRQAPDFTVRPHDLCAVLGIEARARTTLAAIVLPGFDDREPGPGLTRLTPAEAGAALLPHVDRTATDHDPYLTQWFQPRSPEQAQATAQRLADTLPCYRLTQTLATVPSGARLVADLAQSLHPRRPPAPVLATGG